MNYNNVVAGIHKYLEHCVYPTMVGWQKALLRLGAARMLRNQNQLLSIPVVKFLDIFDDEGKVKIDELKEDLLSIMHREGKINLDTSLFGNMSFTADDVHKLFEYIHEE